MPACFEAMVLPFPGFTPEGEWQLGSPVRERPVTWPVTAYWRHWDWAGLQGNMQPLAGIMHDPG